MLEDGACVVAGEDGSEVALTQEDVDLLRKARRYERLYASDNESKWERVLDAGLMDPVPGQGTDWYGGWVALSDRGRALLDRLDEAARAGAVKGGATDGR